MRIIIVLSLIGAACAVPRISERIVGGEITPIENYPFMAAMLFNLRSPICGGSLITSTAVLSAAHCFENDPPTKWKVRLGSPYSTSGGNEHFVSKIISHANYTSGVFINDVAVIKLFVPAESSGQINFARIAGPNYILPDNTLVYGVGWGVKKWRGDLSEELRHVGINIINQEICTERYRLLASLPWMSHIPPVTPKMLCSGILDVGGKGTCQGDSGGPLIHNRDVVVGITSWGHRCAHRIYPTISTRVSSYTDWIYTNSLN